MSKYTYSQKRKQRDFLQANWKQRLQIATMRAEGKTFQQIADALGCNKKNANKIWHKIKHLKIEEIKHFANLLD